MKPYTIYLIKIKVSNRLVHIIGVVGLHEGEEGIPGHASHKPKIRDIQRMLSTIGLNYEVEGDLIRVHLDNTLVEIKDEPGGKIIMEFLTSLPRETGEPSTDYLHQFSLILSMLEAIGPGKSIKYDIDEAAPGYPVLRIYIQLPSLEDAYELLAIVLNYLRDSGLI